MYASKTISADPLETLKHSLRFCGDYEKLMLIDWLVDQVSDYNKADEITSGLSAAFSIEEDASGWVVEYPLMLGAPKGAWERWNEYRDQTLRYRLSGLSL
jgi:hypothetical protein